MNAARGGKGQDGQAGQTWASKEHELASHPFDIHRHPEMKSSKIALVGFDRLTAETMQDEGLNIVAHIYANRDNKRADYPDRPELLNFHEWKRYHFTAPPLSSLSQEQLDRIGASIFAEFVRCTDRWDWSREKVFDWSDYQHLFRLALDHAENWLSTHDPDIVVYSNVPHQGMALAQYAMAQAMGKQTAVFVQSPFAGRSWLLNRFDDFGRFATSAPGEEFAIDISEPETPPFYMKNTPTDLKRQAKVFGHQLRGRLLATFGPFGWTAQSRHENRQRNLGRWQRAIENGKYLQRQARFFRDKPPRQPFVYFPLHLQPEMTTDVLGGRFADQALALEQLRKLVPENISICVKENPKQTGRMRSEAFFQRIGRLSNTVFVSHETPSLELVRTSIATATITGTVGWEALRLGKPAIAFGHCFWNSLPGSFRYIDNPDWSSIGNFSFDRKKLEAATRELGKHAHHGICDPVYAEMVEHFDPRENAVRLADTLKRQLSEHGIRN